MYYTAIPRFSFLCYLQKPLMTGAWILSLFLTLHCEILSLSSLPCRQNFEISSYSGLKLLPRKVCLRGGSPSANITSLASVKTFSEPSSISRGESEQSWDLEEGIPSDEMAEFRFNLVAVEELFDQRIEYCISKNIRIFYHRVYTLTLPNRS